MTGAGALYSSFRLGCSRPLPPTGRRARWAQTTPAHQLDGGGNRPHGDGTTPSAQGSLWALEHWGLLTVTRGDGPGCSGKCPGGSPGPARGAGPSHGGACPQRGLGLHPTCPPRLTPPQKSVRIRVLGRAPSVCLWVCPPMPRLDTGHRSRRPCQTRGHRSEAKGRAQHCPSGPWLEGTSALP